MWGIHQQTEPRGTPAEAKDLGREQRQIVNSTLPLACNVNPTSKNTSCKLVLLPTAPQRTQREEHFLLQKRKNERDLFCAKMEFVKSSEAFMKKIGQRPKKLNRRGAFPQAGLT